MEVNVVFGKKVDASSSKSTPSNTKLEGSLKTATVPSGLGILWSQPRDIHAQKMFRKDGFIQYADAGKTVSLGSSLEIIYPASTLWEEGITRDVSPFLLTGDSDGTVDTCAAVPVGDQSVGVYDADGHLTASRQCVQAGVAGDTTSVAFSVEDLQSPPPHLNATLTIRQQGKTLKDQVDVPGHRQGKDDHHRAQRYPWRGPPGRPRTSGPRALTFTRPLHIRKGWGRGTEAEEVSLPRPMTNRHRPNQAGRG